MFTGIRTLEAQSLRFTFIAMNRRKVYMPYPIMDAHGQMLMANRKASGNPTMPIASHGLLSDMSIIKKTVIGSIITKMEL